MNLHERKRNLGNENPKKSLKNLESLLDNSILLTLRFDLRISIVAAHALAN